MKKWSNPEISKLGAEKTATIERVLCYVCNACGGHNEHNPLQCPRCGAEAGYTHRYLDVCHGQATLPENGGAPDVNIMS